MSKKLYDIISKVFSVQISEINDESSPGTIESWDSFNGLILVDELESNFNIKFSVSEIIDVKNVKDIKRHLNNHGVDLDE
jgi:acyl carrier protein